MKRRFILYKITEIPAGGTSLIYVKEIKYKRPVFTGFKEEAMRIGLIRAIHLSFWYSLSMLPERLV